MRKELRARNHSRSGRQVNSFVGIRFGHGPDQRALPLCFGVISKIAELCTSFPAADRIERARELLRMLRVATATRRPKPGLLEPRPSSASARKVPQASEHPWCRHPLSVVCSCLLNAVLLGYDRSRVSYDIQTIILQAARRGPPLQSFRRGAQHVPLLEQRPVARSCSVA